MRLLSVLLVSLLCAPGLRAQSDPNTPYAWDTQVAGKPSTVVVPASNTLAIAAGAAGYIRVNQVNLTNVTGSTVTFTLTDGSTNCNGGACNLLPSNTPLSIAAGTTFTINLQGQPAVGGVYWSASGTANAIHGWMRGTR